MLIVGAGGFAKEVLEVLFQLKSTKNTCFYDDVNQNTPTHLYEQFPIIKNLEEASNYFKTIDAGFTLGIGTPIIRKKLADKFLEIGGVLTSTISPEAEIGHYGSHVSNGCNVLSGAIISNDVYISKGVIVYFNSIITHDCFIDEYVEISPGAKLLGKSVVGKYCQIGSNSVILPNIKLGENVIVAAGSVVTKDVPDNCMVAGVPAKIKKEINPLEL